VIKSHAGEDSTLLEPLPDFAKAARVIRLLSVELRVSLHPPRHIYVIDGD
jgi:hypothetical protein